MCGTAAADEGCPPRAPVKREPIEEAGSLRFVAHGQECNAGATMGEAAMDGYDDVVGELLAVPPESFTEHRNAAVKALRRRVGAMRQTPSRRSPSHPSRSGR